MHIRERAEELKNWSIEALHRRRHQWWWNPFVGTWPTIDGYEELEGKLTIDVEVVFGDGRKVRLCCLRLNCFRKCCYGWGLDEVVWGTASSNFNIVIASIGGSNKGRDLDWFEYFHAIVENGQEVASIWFSIEKKYIHSRPRWTCALVGISNSSIRLRMIVMRSSTISSKKVLQEPMEEMDTPVSWHLSTIFVSIKRWMSGRSRWHSNRLGVASAATTTTLNRLPRRPLTS